MAASSVAKTPTDKLHHRNGSTAAWPRRPGSSPGRAPKSVLHSSLAVDTGKRGRGVFATAAIKKGETLIRIPASLKIEPTGKLAELVESKEISHLLALVLTFRHDWLYAHPTPPFYSDLFNQSAPRLPFFWPVDELERLVGTSLLPPGVTPADAVREMQTAFDEIVVPAAKLVNDPEFVPKNVDQIKTALAWVVSRGLQGRVHYEHGKPLLPYLAAD